MFSGFQRSPNRDAPLATTPHADTDGATAGNRLVELDETMCLRLLGERIVGRMALTVGALPTVLPINYVLYGRSLVMATDPGLKLRSARSRDVVCLEVDDWDDFEQSGWYVTATGHLSEVSQPEEVEDLAGLTLGRWRHLDEPHLIRLTVELLHGRCLQDRRGS